MKQQWKQILVWLVVLIVVAAAVYYFLTPAGPYLEGFAPSRSVPLVNGKTAITGLYFMQKGTTLMDASLNAVMIDLSNVCPSSATSMSKECFDALIAKFSLSTGVINTPENINVISAQNIVSVLNRQLGVGYSTLQTSDIQTAMSTQADLSDICTVSGTGTISKDCYNALLNAFVINANKDGVVCSKTDDVNMADDDVMDTKKTPKSLTEDIKEASKIIGSSLSNADSTATPAASTIDKTDGSKEVKCTVQFGNDLVSPQTKAASVKTTDKTCTTTGDVAKTTKTPVVEQGCEFTQKFPKVNVINLRDYVHKDEIPCWSCKL
jgi:hypothetical protein